MGTSHSQGQTIRIWWTVLPSFSSLTLTNTLQKKKCGNFLKYLRMFVDVSHWLLLGNKEFCNGTLWQHTSLADLVVRCCRRDAVRHLCNFVCKCKKFDICFIWIVAFPALLPAKKKNWGITAYPVYFVDLYGLVCARMCMLVYMQTGYKWYSYSIYSEWVVLRNCQLRVTSIMCMKKFLLIFVIRVDILQT